MGAKLIAFGTHGVQQERSCASSLDEQKKEIVSARLGLCCWTLPSVNSHRRGGGEIFRHVEKHG
jgi:hypothetical protein